MTARLLFMMTVLCLTVIMLTPTIAGEGMNGPPARPKVFKNPDELKKYLKALNEYFAIVGRPRFGKRGYGVKRPDDWNNNRLGTGHVTSGELDILEMLLSGYRK